MAATYNVIASHSIETVYSGKPQFSNVMGSYFVVAEAVITKKNLHHYTTPYPTHPIKTQPIQLGVVPKVHVRVFLCQGSWVPIL